MFLRLCAKVKAEEVVRLAIRGRMMVAKATLQLRLYRNDQRWMPTIPAAKMIQNVDGMLNGGVMVTPGVWLWTHTLAMQTDRIMQAMLLNNTTGEKKP